MNNLNILAVLADALRCCLPLAWNGHAACQALCIASRQHSHNFTGSKQRMSWKFENRAGSWI